MFWLFGGGMTASGDRLSARRVQGCPTDVGNIQMTQCLVVEARSGYKVQEC